MKKSMIIGIAVVLVASAGILSVLNTTLGVEATYLLGAEDIEKILNLHEENEQGEYSGNEVTDIGEYQQR